MTNSAFESLSRNRFRMAVARLTKQVETSIQVDSWHQERVTLRVLFHKKECVIKPCWVFIYSMLGLLEGPDFAKKLDTELISPSGQAALSGRPHAADDGFGECIVQSMSYTSSIPQIQSTREGSKFKAKPTGNALGVGFGVAAATVSTVLFLGVVAVTRRQRRQSAAQDQRGYQPIGAVGSEGTELRAHSTESRALVAAFEEYDDPSGAKYHDAASQAFPEDGECL